MKYGLDSSFAPNIRAMHFVCLCLEHVDRHAKCTNKNSVTDMA